MKDTNHIVITEREALALLIHYNELICTRLTGDDFRHDAARALFTAINTLFENGDVVTDTTLFREASKLHYNISQDLCKEILSLPVHHESTEAVLRHLHEIKQRTFAEEQAEKLLKIAQDNKLFDVEKATRIAFDIQEKVKVYEEEDTTVSSLKKLLMDSILNPRTRVPTGDSFLDDPEAGLYDGFSPGQLITVAGATGQGKSTYALHLFSKQIDVGEPAIYFNSELPDRSVAERFMSNRTGIAHHQWRVHADKDTTSLTSTVEAEIRKLEDRPFEMVSLVDGTNNIEYIRTRIRDFKRKFGVDHATAYIDLVTMLRECASGSSDSRANAIEYAVDRLNGIAKGENICIVMCAQMNRDADKEKVRKVIEIEEKLKPTLSTIKASSALAERSRVVLSVFRQKAYAVNSCAHDPLLSSHMEQDIMEVSILKQSEGPTMSGFYEFNPNTYQVTQIPTGYCFPKAK